MKTLYAMVAISFFGIATQHLDKFVLRAMPATDLGAIKGALVCWASDHSDWIPCTQLMDDEHMPPCTGTYRQSYQTPGHYLDEDAVLAWVCTENNCANIHTHVHRGFGCTGQPPR